MMTFLDRYLAGEHAAVLRDVNFEGIRSQSWFRELMEEIFET